MTEDPLSTLCVRRLTRLLELSSLEDLKVLGDCAYVAQNVELEEQSLKVFGSYKAGKQNHRSTSHSQVKKLFKFLSRKETPHVFGQIISESTVEFVIQLINHLKLHAGTEGLFRISGNKKRQEELKHILNKGGKLNLNCDDSPYNPHDISGILKQFFGALPEPLLTKQLYDCYQQLAEMDNVSAKNRKIETLKFLFLLLPPLSRLLLKELIELLSVVAEHTSNKMTSYNLGVVFAPNIVYTRQPMDSLSEFAENVEPFTDLVRFVIENAKEVFQIPPDFFEEAKEYLFKIALDKEKSAEVPMKKTFCQQIDSKEFRREAKDNTNEALMMLYTQMMEMPDGPVKNEFIKKFQQSYPGTPLFVPKSVKKELEEDRNHLCPSTPISSTKSENASNSRKCPSTPKMSSKSRQNNGELLNTPECSRKTFSTPTKNSDGVEIPGSSGKVTNTPSTPGARMKQCLKRLRRRSVEIFKPKQAKPSTPDAKLGRKNSSSSLQRGHNAFRSYRLPGGKALKALKKSVSTPGLSNIQRRTSFDGDDNVRKLSFTGESPLRSDSKDFKKDLNELRNKDRPISFTFGEAKSSGIVNFAFNDTPKKATPVIKKTLYPSVRKKSEETNFVVTPHRSTFLKSKFDMKSENRAMPVIGKPFNLKHSNITKQSVSKKVIDNDSKQPLSDITNNLDKMMCLSVKDRNSTSLDKVFGDNVGRNEQSANESTKKPLKPVSYKI